MIQLHPWRCLQVSIAMFFLGLVVNAQTAGINGTAIAKSQACPDASKPCPMANVYVKVTAQGQPARRTWSGQTPNATAGYFELLYLPEDRLFSITVTKVAPDGTLVYRGSATARTAQDLNLPVDPEFIELIRLNGANAVAPPARPVMSEVTITLVKLSLDEPAMTPKTQSRDSGASLAGHIAIKSGRKLGRVRIILTRLPPAPSGSEKPANTEFVISDKLTDAFQSNTGDFKLPIPGGKFELTFWADGHLPAEFLVIKGEETGPIRVFDAQAQQVDWRTNFEVRLEPLIGVERDILKDVSPRIINSTPTLNHVFVQRSLESIPIPGIRSFDSFALFVPGVLPPPASTGGAGLGVSAGLGTPGQFSVNGLRARENNFTVDGSDNNDEDTGTRRQGYVCLVPQSIESLSEFQITTALADTRYGRNLGGQIDALSKSGERGLHGNAYGFATDSRLNARDFFDSSTPNSGPLASQSSNGSPILVDGNPLFPRAPAVGRTPMTRVQTGFVAGGPMPGTDYSFFFTSFERDENHVSHRAHFAVPTVKQRGIFETGETGFRTSQGASLFPSSIPGDAIFSLYPFPNNPAGPYGENTYSEVIQGDGHGTRASGKLSHQFGSPSAAPHGWPWTFFKDGHTISGRYNVTDETSLIPVTGGALFSSLKPRVRTQNAAFFYNRVLRQNLGDTIRFSFGRTSLSFDPVRDQFLLPSSLDEPFLLNAPLLLNVSSPANEAMKGPNYMSATSPTGRQTLSSLGYNSITGSEQITGPLGQVMIAGFSPIGVDVFNFPQKRANNTFQVADTITYLRGPHLFTGGFEVRKALINDSIDRNFRPLAVFNGLLRSAAALPITGARGEDLDQRVLSGATLAAMGVPTGMFQTFAAAPDSTIGIRFTQANFFIQDELRLNSTLRVTFGLRYEYNNDPETKGGKLERAFDRDKLRLQAEEAQDLCRARCPSLVNDILAAFPASYKLSFATDKNHFNPRVGFAWDPTSTGHLAVRGGFGFYSGQVAGVVIDQSRNAFSEFIPLNTANFSARGGDTTYLFNIANPTIGQLVPRLRVIQPGSLNALASGINPIFLLGGSFFLLDTVSLSPTFPGLDLVFPQAGLKNPYAYHYALTTEAHVAKHYIIRLSYVGTRGIHLLRLNTPELGSNKSAVRFDSNAAVSALGSTAFPFFKGDLTSPQDQKRIAGLFTIQRTLFQTSASSTYNSLQIQMQRIYANHLQVSTAFTYSHSIDDASDFFDNAGAFALPQNSVNPVERASSNFDARIRSVTTFIWDLPFQEKKTWGGWQVSGVFTAQTGQPYTVNSAVDVNRDGNLTDRLSTTERLFKGPSEAGRRGQLWLFPGTDPASLLASAGEDGAIARNTFRAPGILTLDLAATKRIRMRDTDAFVIRAEVFNLFNRTHFGVPGRILESPGFGTSVTTALPNRIIQIALKYVF